MGVLWCFQDTRNRHRSPLKTCLSPNGRNVRFYNHHHHQRSRAASCSPECEVIYPTKCSRGSSIVRVYSRSNSPICETIVASTLPSKAASEAAVSNACSIACECNLPPFCLPKPRGNLKYSHILKPVECCEPSCSCQCLPCCCDVQLPPPPPLSFIDIACDPCDTKQFVERCTNTVPECPVVECCQVVNWWNFPSTF